MPPASPLDIAWDEPIPVEAATAQTAPGVFIIEQSDGNESWTPLYVGAAADSLGSRLRALMDDIQAFGSGPDWQLFRVRPGLIPISPSNLTDRATLRAISHDVAARIRASGAGDRLAPKADPNPRQQRLLAERGVHDTGAVPEYLVGGPAGEPPA